MHETPENIVTTDILYSLTFPRPSPRLFSLQCFVEIVFAVFFVLLSELKKQNKNNFAMCLLTDLHKTLIVTALILPVSPLNHSGGLRHGFEGIWSIEPGQLVKNGSLIPAWLHWASIF